MHCIGQGIDSIADQLVEQEEEFAPRGKRMGDRQRSEFPDDALHTHHTPRATNSGNTPSADWTIIAYRAIISDLSPALPVKASLFAPFLVVGLSQYCARA